MLDLFEKHLRYFMYIFDLEILSTFWVWFRNNENF